MHTNTRLFVTRLWCFINNRSFDYYRLLLRELRGKITALTIYVMLYWPPVNNHIITYAAKYLSQFDVFNGNKYLSELVS